jgi:5-methylcytosine-specific restriction endonuclease McrA
MPKKLQQYRNEAYQRQHGRCVYCAAPMWERDPTAFTIRYCLTNEQALRFRCTAEHLVARSDGGSDRSDNIAAACWSCNSGRHKRKCPPDPEAFRNFVRERIVRRRWHPSWVFEAGVVSQTALGVRLANS